MAGKNKNSLLFALPADHWGAMWRDALPSGNGTIGASVLGGAGDEVVLVNHASLAWQGSAGVLPDVSDKITEVRKQIGFGDYLKADKILPDALISKGYRPSPAFPLPLCDVKVHQDFDRPVKEYSRWIQTETGEVIVSYREGMTRYERKLFVSRANDLIVYEITKNGPKNIDLRFSVDLHDRFNVRTPSAVSKLPENPVSRYEKYFMYFAARNDTAQDFGLVARISTFGGTVASDLRGVTVKGAEKVLVLMKPFVESARDKEFKALRSELAANKLTYEKMLKEHVAIHGKLFSAVELTLDADADNESMECVFDRCKREGTVSPAVMQRMWAFGRYLLISGTGTNGRIMRPCGLWCGDYKATKGYTDAAGGLQMLYAQALSGGLAEFVLPVFERYGVVLDELKKNATRLYNCRGILIPPVTTPGSGLLGTVTPEVIHTTWVAGSIGALMYDYASYTQDAKFLKTRALPFMKEVAAFYAEFFKVRMDGKVDSSPGYSHGNSPLGVTPDNEEIKIAKNCVIDFDVARELLRDLIRGAKETGLFKNEIESWTTLLGRIPDTAARNSDGTVSEYLDADEEDNYDSGSMNMLYGVYPGTTANLSDQEEERAYAATAKKRAVTGLRRFTAPDLMTLAAVFAHLNSGNESLETIETAMAAFINSNATLTETSYQGMGVGQQNFWATYNLTANCGLTAAVQEMLVQSGEDEIRILPARPDEWQKGSIQGVCTRSGATVDVEWENRHASFRIRAKRAKSLRIFVPNHVGRVKGVKNFDTVTHSFTVDFASGKAVTFSF